MAFVVRRPGGRWEIRESVQTARGPRARSLATFRVLGPEVLDKAERAATAPLDRDAVLLAARASGAPVGEPPPDRAARTLIIELATGRRVSPGLERLLRDMLGDGRSADSVAEWVGATAAARGAALRDLLGLADRLPAPRRGELRFPPLRAAG